MKPGKLYKINPTGSVAFNNQYEKAVLIPDNTIFLLVEATKYDKVDGNFKIKVIIESRIYIRFVINEDFISWFEEL